MPTNPTPAVRPPEHGYRSYAEMLKQYIIYGRFFAGWRKRQGKFEFRVMYAPDPDNNRWHYNRQPIGYEMVDVSLVTRNRRRYQEPEGNDWAIRAYLDGTMLVRWNRFSGMRYPASSKIRDMVQYFYYREDTQDDRGIEQERYYRPTVEIWRRKPVNPYVAQPNANNFGRYLEQKYNTGGRSNG